MHSGIRLQLFINCKYFVLSWSFLISIILKLDLFDLDTIFLKRALLDVIISLIIDIELSDWLFNLVPLIVLFSK